MKLLQDVQRNRRLGRLRNTSPIISSSSLHGETPMCLLHPAIGHTGKLHDPEDECPRVASHDVTCCCWPMAPCSTPHLSNSTHCDQPNKSAVTKSDAHRIRCFSSHCTVARERDSRSRNPRHMRDSPPKATSHEQPGPCLVPGASPHHKNR